MTKHRKTIVNEVEKSVSDRSLSLTDQVYGTLKEEILRVHRAPGEILAEPELAAQFGISKTPIREALRLLVQDGWVRVLPRKGYLIRPLGLDDVREVFSLRQMLEPAMAAEAARRATARDIERLSELLRGQAEADGVIEQALLSARLFHLALAGIAGNTRGVRLLAALLDEVKRLHYLMPDLESHITSTVEIEAHREIAAAIAAQDPDRARELVAAHLTEVSRAMVQSFSGLSHPAAEGPVH
jgi:DNA-binding GntR family transcriptional regulator